ncbi:hypothetical protein FB451DRAFT_1044251, partial [Mycena latifolia]
IRLGTSIRHTNRRGYSPLYLGCTILKDLIQDDVTRTVYPPPGRMSSQEFLLSVVSQMRQICLLLLENHADANETHDGLSLLALACLGDEWDLTKALLLHGAQSCAPPTKLPVQYLKTERARALFSSLASKFANKPRPPRPCPCCSGRALEDCHGQAEAQPYPADAICPCGSAKIHAQCCVKRTDMYWVEHWVPHEERLQRVAVPRSAPLLEKISTMGFLMDKDNIQNMLRRQLAEVHAMLKDLAKTGRIDPAYAAAGCLVSYQPISPSAVHTMSKIELNDSIRLWNEAVDVYIGSNVDPRKPEVIENAAKVGLAGGPLHRRCEASGCRKLDGRSGVKLLRCNGCKKAMYCGTDCQKSAWKKHKPVCKSGDAKIQMLPSQLEYHKEITKKRTKQVQSIERHVPKEVFEELLRAANSLR